MPENILWNKSRKDNKMEDRIMKLYKELDFLLNNSPIENDCSDEQNEMYSDMADLKESIEKALYYMFI